MTDPVQAIQFDKSTMVKILQAIDNDIPKLKSLLQTLNDRPVLIGLIERLVPNVAQFLSVVQEVAPYLDFVQQLDEEILKAVA